MEGVPDIFAQRIVLTPAVANTAEAAYRRFMEELLQVPDAVDVVRGAYEVLREVCEGYESGVSGRMNTGCYLDGPKGKYFTALWDADLIQPVLGNEHTKWFMPTEYGLSLRRESVQPVS